ncbi:MAG: gliding motility-associated C-terminal domain-containing protein [Bacteroidales bacterium]|nr:gliding motility-associated C-terminal domain-containing protein [Bacteroidales bacterium]
MKFLKFTTLLLFLVTITLNLFSQDYDITKIEQLNSRAPVTYNTNITLGGDNVLSSLKINVIGDNLQIWRNIGSNSWEYQYFEWSDHPGRGIHLYINGSYYYVNSSTDIYVNGVPSGSNLSYLDGYGGIPYDRIDITRIDNYNATVKIVKANVIEALLTINYPSESDYINYSWVFTNLSSGTLSDLRFYQEGDTYSYGSDYGVGYWDESRYTVGCQKEDNGGTVSVFLQALEEPFQHESARWGWSSGVEAHVMANALTGEVLTTSHDNAIALEWRKPSLAVGETWTIHTIEKYSDKDITNLIVTAPLNETIRQGETKYINFNVRNYSFETVNDISLNEIIDLAGWTIDVLSPIGNFSLLPTEETEVTIAVTCPITEIPGTIAKATLEATANETTADDKAYIEVLSILPSIDQQPLDQDVCTETDAVSFSVTSENAIAYQWEQNGVNIIDGGVFSGATTETLNISDVTGLIGEQFRCHIANNYGDAFSDYATIIADQTPPVSDAISLPDAIGQCDVSSIIPPTATDACEGGITGTTDAEFPIGVDTTIVWAFEDSFGNTSYILQDIVINDVTEPTPSDASLPTIIDWCQFTIEDFPTAMDNCDGEIIGTTNDTNFYDVGGTYIINWIYEDKHGNIATQAQTLILANERPVPETKDTTITISSAGTENVTITPADIDDGSFDDCGIDSMYLDITQFTSENEGENIVNLTVVDFEGNDSTKSAIVTIVLDYELLFPNFISPDEDGVNDYWEIVGVQDLKGFTLDIFNNIGETVYHTRDYDNTWDAKFNGEPLPDGTYYYVFKSGKESYSGFISVIK